MSALTRHEVARVGFVLGPHDRPRLLALFDRAETVEAELSAARAEVARLTAANEGLAGRCSVLRDALERAWTASLGKVKPKALDEWQSVLATPDAAVAERDEKLRKDAADAMRSLILGAPEVTLGEWLAERDERLRREASETCERLAAKANAFMEATKALLATHGGMHELGVIAAARAQARAALDEFATPPPSSEEKP